MKQSRPLQWDRIHTELWVQSATAPNLRTRNFQRGPNSNFRPSTPQFQRNVCWAYNRGGSCTRPECRFQHICSKCRGQHPSTTCTNNPRNSGNPAPPNTMHNSNQGQPQIPQETLNHPRETNNPITTHLDSKVVTPVKVDNYAPLW